MPYFVDRYNTVIVTMTGQPAPNGCRELDRSTADAVRLRHGQQLSQERVECALVGDVEGYLAAPAEYTRPAIDPDQSAPGSSRGAKPPMLLSTTPFLDGWTIVEALGLVTGNTIRTRNVLSRAGSGLKSLVGGELSGMVKALSDSRDEAVLRMVDSARALGADAIVGVAFSASEMFETATEILVAGTAVKATREN